ncbi:MAG: Hsp70 family protein [Deltaproteobacteria bacterium]|nr:Hsp70 family protein [Deltaproteobacteria bacterium]
MTTSSLGVDFGTSNSSLALCAHHTTSLVNFQRTDGSLTPTFRSVLFFETPDRGPAPAAIAGPKALERYLDTGGTGRLLQSLKSYLASTLFSGTQIHHKNYTLVELIAIILRQLRTEAERTHGALPARALFGRPVKFVGDTDTVDDTLPLQRLREAAAIAGFSEVHFEYEPVAAAHSYEQGLTREELVLVGDFGGGTSDFCLMRLGPSRKDKRDRSEDILGTEGVGLAGDSFDGQIVQHRVAPALGQGTSYRSFMEQREIPIPPWIFEKLRRWHHLSFLKTPDNMRLLKEMRSQALARDKITALVHLVEDDLGPALFRSVERCKLELSQQTQTALTFSDPPVELNELCERVHFNQWIHAELGAITGCIDRLLAQTKTDPTQIDRVFLTGGSALVPAVRAIFAARFGEDKITGGNELTSVATGLSLRAQSLGL